VPPASCSITLCHNGVTVLTCQSVPLATQEKVGCGGFHSEPLGCRGAIINERRIVSPSVLLTRLDTDHTRRRSSVAFLWGQQWPSGLLHDFDQVTATRDSRPLLVKIANQHLETGRVQAFAQR
jgi:hypothetical protein